MIRAGAGSAGRNILGRGLGTWVVTSQAPYLLLESPESV